MYSPLGALLSVLHIPSPLSPSFFFFNDTATTEIYTLSLHDALPIFNRSSCAAGGSVWPSGSRILPSKSPVAQPWTRVTRSEEHTSELQSLAYLVCRLLLEKKKHKAWMVSSECVELDERVAA